MKQDLLCATLALAAALLLPAAARASWLLVQEGEAPAGAALRTPFFDARGGRHTLALRESRPAGAAAAVELPVPVSDVLWADLIGPDAAGRLKKGLILQGTEAGGALRVSEVIPIEERPAGPAPMPLDTDLIPSLRASAFGREQRVTVRSEAGRLVVECRPGSAPAGVVLTGGPWYLPESVGLLLTAEAAGTGSFEWSVSDARRTRSESPLQLGTAEAREQSQTFLLPIPPQGLERRSWAGWTISCPRGGGRLVVTSLRLSTTGRRAQAPGRSAWAWQPALWLETPDALLARVRRLGADAVYITLLFSPDGDGVAQGEALASFIRRAGDAGVRVWAVMGDPRAVLPENRARFVRRAAACAAYNRQARETERLAGIQYDIEPYLVPGFSLDPDAWHRSYLETIAALKKAADLPLEVALPFWFARAQVDGEPLLDRLAPVVESIAVMDYRTDAAQIRAFAEPFLAWGERYGRHVRVALEAGPIGDEARRHYRPADAGEVWHVRAGGRDVLLLLRKAGKNPHGAAFAWSRRSQFQGSTLSYHGQEEALFALLPNLESGLSAWPSFADMALHGLVNTADLAK